MRIRTLDNRYASQIYGLLLQDVDSNLFLLDILMRRGISSWGMEDWHGVFDGEKLISLCVSIGRQATSQPSRLVVGCGDPAGCILLGNQEQLSGGTRMLIGEREASDGIFEGMGRPSARINYDQRLYVCEEPTKGPTIKLKYASLAEFEDVFHYSAEMMKVDLLTDPRDEGDGYHRSAINYRIKNNKTLVSHEDGKICFLLDIGTYFNLGAQVGGTYVPIGFRKRGLASAGMRSSCLLLLNQCKKVTLHVHEENIPAIRLYEKVGFQPSTAYRLISFEHPKSNV